MTSEASACEELEPPRCAPLVLAMSVITNKIIRTNNNYL